MSDWLFSNYTWLFSGAGLFMIAALWGIAKYGYSRWREARQVLEGNGLSRVEYSEAAVATKRSFLPAFIRRAIIKPEDVTSRVHISLRDKGGLQVSLGSVIPCVDLYFQITNLSTVDLILDRLLIDVWFGQPTFQAAMLTRHTIPAGEITSGIHLRHMLADNQCKEVQARTADRSRVTITVVAYFESDIGRIVVVKTIERDA